MALVVLLLVAVSTKTPTTNPSQEIRLQLHQNALHQCMNELETTENALETCNFQFNRVNEQAEELLNLLQLSFNQTQEAMEYCVQE